MTALELARYRFVIEPLDTLTLPAYKGSTFRGGFGTVFRRVACACGQDAALPALPDTARLPHPFVLEAPREAQRLYAPGECLVLHLVLIGRAMDWLLCLHL